MLAQAIVTISAAAAPTIPVQAQWDAARQPTVTATIAAPAKPIGIDDTLVMEVKVSVDHGSLRASPFLNATRGVSLSVTDAEGAVIKPLEPIPVSPAAPPVQPASLVSIQAGKPLSIPIKEQARFLFPGAGTYKVRATIRFMDASSTPPRYLTATSDAVSVKVTRGKSR
ncbi:hypothetical protein [Novosphingobium sp. 9U]|uniref:hypothetical protein n=1 Tax=Novosphingobium sp. 9U TaxID=2653158 RepID=UPI0012EEF28A|nr:hypothetical protein [Novosphingobium sp. 9U]VWX48789.1 proteasome regulatory subunit Rpn4 [Novosphingobium sp. 9U]